jgi:hypothetical protein
MERGHAEKGIFFDGGGRNYQLAGASKLRPSSAGRLRRVAPPSNVRRGSLLFEASRSVGLVTGMRRPDAGRRYAVAQLSVVKFGLLDVEADAAAGIAYPPA